MELINKMIVMNGDIGVHGNLFGGRLMEWVDEAAGALATEYCQTPHMVTLRVGEFIFKKPLKQSNHVRIYGEIERLGNTSITMNIEARRLNVYTGQETIACTTSITYVCIDDNGESISINDNVKEKWRQESMIKE